MKRREFALLLLSLPFASFADIVKERCPICGMFVTGAVPHSFEATKEGKKLHFCSFSCAHAFKRKYPEAQLTAFAEGSGKAIPAEDAYYLVGSEKYSGKFKMAMAPVVVAFSSQAEAQAAQSKVGEGQVLKGFSALQMKLAK